MCHMHVLGLWELPDSKESVTEYMSTELRGGSALSVFQGSADKNTLIIKMTEVRVHAAFKVKDDPTFLKEAAKIVEATQVKRFAVVLSQKKRPMFCLFIKFLINFRQNKAASTTSFTRREQSQAVMQ